MTRKLQFDFITLDVFTQVRYTGNPLAVVKVPHSETLTQQQKQLIAREFNYSETVILHENQEVGDNPQWKIDIFLTYAETPFAGHPAVGTACLLGKQLLDSAGGIDQVNGTLITKAGPVPFAYMRQSNTAQCEVPHDIHVHPKTLSVEDAESVGLPRTVFFFAKDGHIADGSTKLRTRMLVGSLEDPATGSASSALAAYEPDTGTKFHMVQGFEMGWRSESELKSFWKKIGSTRSPCVDPQ